MNSNKSAILNHLTDSINEINICAGVSDWAIQLNFPCLTRTNLSSIMELVINLKIRKVLALVIF